VREIEAVMNDVDVFLSPALSASLTMTNLSGHPALAMKAGFSDGLPVSLMMTGRLYDEATLLQLARAYERLTSWHTRHPSLDGVGTP
jgi:Asp-tRNA(Asn)/Glu-tRNA(Gln) amidotransferase A subunit family amidase